MKRNLPWARSLAMVAGLAGLAAYAESSQPLPTPFPQARYQLMSARSPFALATASVATAAPTPGFAAQLYVDGVAHVGSTDFVAIKSRDASKPVAIFLEVGKSTGDGLKVESVKWSDVMGKSTVDVSKGGERATLIFDEHQIAQEAAPAPVPQGMQFPGHPFFANGFPVRAFPQNPGQPPGVYPAGSPVWIRRRMRGLIQSPQ